jgi:parallel beta-helix repeat protein
MVDLQHPRTGLAFACLTSAMAVACTEPLDPNRDATRPGVTTANATAPTTTISPGQSIQAAVNAHPNGTTFTLKRGVHRMQSVQPKSGNTFIGETGAVMSGARLLTSFTRAGAYWVAGGQNQQGTQSGVCQTGREGCKYPEEVFIDDRLLTHVTALSKVAPGKWYFDYAADKIYLADNPSGHRVETSVSSYAFAGGAGNVTIRNLIIEKYASPAQMGTIVGSGTSGWIVEDNEVRWNHGTGIGAGAQWRILRNKVHHNGLNGISSGAPSGLVVDGNEVAYNNTAGFSQFWAAGGLKFTKAVNLTVRNNYIHHNDGMGVWTDTSYPKTLYENNRVTDNTYGGIYHEVSYDAVIRYNTCERNGLAKVGALRYGGISVDNSPNVEIYGNTLSGNRDGIGGRQVSHAVTTGPYGPLQLKNLYVHDNKVAMSQSGGYNGIVQYVNDNSYYTSRNNRFAKNSYTLSGTALYFHWQGSPRTDSQWRGYGEDVNGTFNR